MCKEFDEGEQIDVNWMITRQEENKYYVLGLRATETAAGQCVCVGGALIMSVLWMIMPSNRHIFKITAYDTVDTVSFMPVKFCLIIPL